MFGVLCVWGWGHLQLRMPGGFAKNVEKKERKKHPATFPKILHAFLIWFGFAALNRNPNAFPTLQIELETLYWSAHKQVFFFFFIYFMFTNLFRKFSVQPRDDTGSSSSLLPPCAPTMRQSVSLMLWCQHHTWHHCTVQDNTPLQGWLLDQQKTCWTILGSNQPRRGLALSWMTLGGIQTRRGLALGWMTLGTIQPRRGLALGWMTLGAIKPRRGLALGWMNLGAIQP